MYGNGFAAVVLAAGKGRRFKDRIPKQFIPVGGTADTCPMCLTVRFYANFPGIKRVYLVLPGDNRPCLECPIKCSLDKVRFEIGRASCRERV
jgi:2-C-methyl-D-erythritol 4-phosphate cytidylyltransferase